MLAVGVFSAASCTSDLDNTTATIDGKDIRFVVGDFPAFGESGTRAVGTPDEGKTSWENGDELLLEMSSKTLGPKYATFTYNDSEWKLTSGELAYKEDEYPTFPHVYYAPNYKWKSGQLTLKEGKVAGTDEYIEGKAQITPNGEAITVSFSNAERNYSRLRIATNLGKSITVIAMNFQPANTMASVNNTYSLTPDAKGNVYLYGHFKWRSSVIVKSGESFIVDYTFNDDTKNGISYALDATVISLEGMNSEEIDAAVEKMASEVNAGKTNFNILLSPELDREVFENIHTGLAEAGYCTINLTLMGCKKIPAGAFMGCNWLKSITLPAVTEIGEYAFASCQWLQKVVFGTPLTKMDGKNGSMGIFDGCTTTDINLVLSAEQKMMTGSDVGSDYVWTPSSSGQNYQDSDAHQKQQFIGYTFKSVTCGVTYP